MGCGATLTQRGPRLAGERKVHVSHKQYKILKILLICKLDFAKFAILINVLETLQIYTLQIKNCKVAKPTNTYIILHDCIQKRVRGPLSIWLILAPVTNVF